MEMKNNFDRAIIEILKHEGGYVNHPNDPGGETNFGITKKVYPDLDIKNLTVEQAKEIYKRDYWLTGLDGLSYPVAAKVFDMVVNMGVRQAIKLVQRAVDEKADGILGHSSIANLKATPDALQRICNQQALFYNALVVTKPSLKVFLKGWLIRASWKPKE